MDSCTMITHIYEDCFTGASATLPWGQSSVWWCYNAINFIPNPHSRHPIARPWGRGMGCLLWVNSDFSSTAVIALLCVISWYVAPHFNETPDVWYLITTRPQSIETPSTVDPQWNVLYWGSKCWGAAGCEWATTSIYFWITYVCFILSRLPVFTVEFQYQNGDF